MKNHKFSILACAILLGIIAVGGYFGSKIIYNQGREAGLKESHDELNELSSAIKEEADFNTAASSLMNNIPITIDTDGINKYIDNVTNLINSTSNEDVKLIMEEYLVEWNNFKDTYAGRDNDAIEVAFRALEKKATETAARIKAAFDKKINETISVLKH